MHYTADELIARFGLTPHVEGGAFRELYKDGCVPDGTRPAHGVIYYLLGEDETSDFHVLDADEYWHGMPGRISSCGPIPRAIPPR